MFQNKRVHPITGKLIVTPEEYRNSPKISQQENVKRGLHPITGEKVVVAEGPAIGKNICEKGMEEYKNNARYCRWDKCIPPSKITTRTIDREYRKKMGVGQQVASEARLIKAIESAIGTTFEQITYLGYGDKWYTIKCKCTCGIIRDVPLSYINKIKSCGCLKPIHGITKTHGLGNTPEYRIWHTIKQYCYNMKFNGYKHRGAFGVKVCDRWLNSVETFLKDMGYRPDGHVFRRIDKFEHYTPDNCHWVTLEDE